MVPLATSDAIESQDGASAVKDCFGRLLVSFYVVTSWLELELISRDQLCCCHCRSPCSVVLPRLKIDGLVRLRFEWSKHKQMPANLLLKTWMMMT